MNADVQNSGFLILKIIDQNDRVLRESEKIMSDMTEAPVSWKKAPDLRRETGSVRLRFEFKKATVYSFAEKN
ncbi:MAG: hypothetical protein O2951_12135 [Bacteroidetes bacterium]|nr:hypothetical protein [Bacteroidota bacterium]